jgi:hypothetical protein
MEVPSDFVLMPDLVTGWVVDVGIFDDFGRDLAEETTLVCILSESNAAVLRLSVTQNAFGRSTDLEPVHRLKHKSQLKDRPLHGFVQSLTRDVEVQISRGGNLGEAASFRCGKSVMLLAKPKPIRSSRKLKLSHFSLPH